MTFAKLKEAVIRLANDKGDEIYPQDVAKKLKVPKEQATKALLALHKEGKLVCADGCKKCDG